MNAAEQNLLLEYMTWEQARAAMAAGRPLIVPVGSVEQHGPHLPLGTDAIVAAGLARRVARQHGCVVAPAIYYAARSSPRSGGGGRSFPGSTGVTARTLIEVVRDLTAELFRSGFRRLVYLNSHYENASLVYEALTETIEAYQDTCRAVMINWWEQVTAQDIEPIFGDQFPGWEAEHAGVAETSLMEELRPDLVHTDLKGEGGTPRMVTYDIFPTPTDVIPPTGVPWRADLASPQTGKYLAGVLVDRIGAVVAAEFPDQAAGREASGTPATPGEGAA